MNWACLLAVVVSAPAPSAGDTVRQVERALKAAVQPGAPAEALRAAVADTVDFPELARRGMGPAWTSMGPQDQSRLVDLLRRIMEANYLTKLRKAPAWSCEVTATRRVAGADIVTLTTTAQGRRIAVELHLTERAGRWRVHDAFLGGVGMVDGWAEQFARLLQKGGLPALFAALEAKARTPDGAAK